MTGENNLIMRKQTSGCIPLLLAALEAFEVAFDGLADLTGVAFFGQFDNADCSTAVRA